ncbi:hypothetical protein ABW19_dt0203450 [Dactylella cylindrospora]|nr:hypothetical protein ABW19_dt0203450 [Dactylella cylindrospora]
MFKSTIILAFGAATAVSGFVLGPRAACNADLCLRSVRATQRTGSADCASFWRTTYTPDTVTVMSTLTVSVPTTTTLSTTEVDTIHLTSITQIPSTLTITVQSTVTNTITMGINFFKRQEPGNIIPTYASACSGTVRYSSACSCVGVSTITTITAPAPTTIVTVSETEIYTETSTSILDTIQVSTTDATSTQVFAESTKTVIIGPTATATLFALKIASGPYANQWLTRKSYAGSDTKALGITTNSALAEPITLHPNGRISLLNDGWPGTIYAGGIPPSVNNVVFQWEQNFSFGISPLSCGLTWDRYLTCTSAGGFKVFGIAYGSLMWAGTDSQLSQVGGIAVQLKAVALPS